MTQQINLYNPAFEKQKKVFTATTMAVSLGLLLIGTLALAGYARNNVARLQRDVASGEERVQQKKLRQASALVEFAPRTSDPQVAKDTTAAIQEQGGVKEVLDLLQGGSLGNTIGYSPYFKALARQGGGDVWLTGVQIEGAGAQLGLEGRALNAALVPEYIKRLTREPALRGKTFASLDMKRMTAPLGADGQPTTATPPFIEFSLQAVQTAAPVKSDAPMAGALNLAPSLLSLTRAPEPAEISAPGTLAGGSK